MEGCQLFFEKSECPLLSEDIEARVPCVDTHYLISRYSQYGVREYNGTSQNFAIVNYLFR